MTAIDGSVYTFRADNGLTVRVRRLCPDDYPYLLAIFEKMSAESRYLRFNQSLVNVDPEWAQEQARRIADVPPEMGAGWLAFADLPGEENAPVGGIRCLHVSANVAEISLAVRDDLQGLGIGSHLLEYACRQAYVHGYRRVIGVAHSYNMQLWRSLRRLGIPTARRRDGSTVIIEADLEGLGLESTTPESIKDES